MRATAALLTAVALSAHAAATYPVRAIRLVVGFSAGGAADISARAVAKSMGESLNTVFVVENRTGAGGSLAAQLVANAPPDGYTLLWGSVGALTVNPLLSAGMGYDAVTGFTSISERFAVCNALIAQPGTGLGSVSDLIARARAHPDGLSFGTQGIGSAGQLSGNLLQNMTGIRLVHVPYKGAPQIIASVAGNEIPVGFVSATAASSVRMASSPPRRRRRPTPRSFATTAQNGGACSAAEAASSPCALTMRSCLHPLRSTRTS
jgi:tripartite-type tricarboxylate transporter receptor subunit TctC